MGGGDEGNFSVSFGPKLGVYALDLDLYQAEPYVSNVYPMCI